MRQMVGVVLSWPRFETLTVDVHSGRRMALVDAHWHLGALVDGLARVDAVVPPIENQWTLYAADGRRIRLQVQAYMASSDIVFELL